MVSTTPKTNQLEPQRDVKRETFHTIIPNFLHNKAKIFEAGIVNYLIKYISSMWSIGLEETTVLGRSTVRLARNFSFQKSH